MSNVDNLLYCRMCGYERFHLFTRAATAAVPEVRAFFGLFLVVKGQPAIPENLTATCLRCSCVHTQDQITGKTVRGALG